MRSHPKSGGDTGRAWLRQLSRLPDGRRFFSSFRHKTVAMASRSRGTLRRLQIGIALRTAMAKTLRALLWKLCEDTANEISEIQQGEEIDAWIDEQSEPTAVSYGEDLAAVVGFSLKTH
jgi:hypothetical protein